MSTADQDVHQPNNTARFTFFGGLADLLVRRYREQPIHYSFKESPGIKDAIEAMGIPHTEVDIILVNSQSVHFSYHLQHNDNIHVYPVYVQPEGIKPLYLACRPTPPVSFVLDVHLGKLAQRLRLLGFDCVYRNDFDDAEIMDVSQSTGRIILTRDLGILKHRKVVLGYLVRSDRVGMQVKEVLTRFQLTAHIDLFRRCMICNGLMIEVDKVNILKRLEPKTKLYYDDFHECADCGRIYWQGSHYGNIRQWLETLLPDVARRH